MSRLLMRDPRRGVVGGVAVGFGDYLQVDPVLVRIGFALLTFVHGIGLLLYLVCWVLMPLQATAPAAAGESAPAAPAASAAPYEVGTSAAGPRTLPSADTAAAQLAVGAVLVFVGALLLAHNLDWLRWPHWLRFETLWPLLLVALGLGLIGKSRRNSPVA